MKNTLLKLISLTLITLLMVFSFSGCFFTNLIEKQQEAEEIASTLNNLDDDDLDGAQDALASAESYYNDLPNLAKPSNIEEYLSNSSVKTQIDSQLSSMQTSEYGVSVEADDNELIYVFKYKVLVDNAAAKTAIEQGITSVDSYYTSLVDTMQAMVTTPGVTITIKYLNMDGSLIYSKTYR